MTSSFVYHIDINDHQPPRYWKVFPNGYFAVGTFDNDQVFYLCPTNTNFHVGITSFVQLADVTHDAMLTCRRTAPWLLQLIRAFLTVYQYCYIFIFNCVSCGRQFFFLAFFLLPPVPGDWLVRVISDRRLWIMKQDSSLPDGSPNLLACLSSSLTDNAVHYTYVKCLYHPPDVATNTIGNVFVV